MTRGQNAEMAACVAAIIVLIFAMGVFVGREFDVSDAFIAGRDYGIALAHGR